MHPTVAFALADHGLKMPVVEHRLMALPHAELCAQIRMLSRLSRHHARVLAAAHRARKRQNRESRS